MRKCYSLKVAILFFFLIITLTGCNFTEIIDWVTPPGTNPEVCNICNLPAYPINVKMNSTYYFFSESYFNIELKNVGPGYDIYDGNWTGWCADKETLIESYVWYQGYIYCSYSPSNRYGIEWPKINWIINNKGSYSAEYIQDAIWHFTNGYTPNGLAMAAEAHSDFYPQSGQKYITIIDVPGKQLTFIEVPLIEEQEIEFEGSADTLYTCCDGCCLDLGVSEFHQFNVIDYHDKSKVTLKPKVGSLPKNIRITLEGIRFDIEKEISFSGNTCSTQPDLVTGDWSVSPSTIAEATFKNGSLTSRDYESINGYIIEVDFLSSQIYIKLSENRSHAFKAVPWKGIEKGIEMKVYNLSGKEIGSYSFNKGIFPKVESNFGQCVWWAIRRKWETDKKIIEPKPSFYPPPGGQNITNNYSPAKNDVLVAYYDNTMHYAFIEEDIDGETVIISQFNYPKQERKSVQKLRWKNSIWSVPNLGNCKFYFQFNYYIRDLEDNENKRN